MLIAISDFLFVHQPICCIANLATGQIQPLIRLNSMDDMKDKMKGFMKKVNNPFSSSTSGKFKGSGRVLGSSSSPNCPTQPLDPATKPSPPAVNSKPPPQKPLTSGDTSRPVSVTKQEPIRKPSNGFDPYDSLVTTGKRSQNGFTLNVFECPVCGRSYRSEDEVSLHVESCLDQGSAGNDNGVATNVAGEVSGNDEVESRTELEACVSVFLSGKPAEGSLEIVLRLLRNIAKEPGNGKFRKIRMSNPKIREAVGDVAGGIELLEVVGFELREEGGEMWAVMQVPKEEQISTINRAIGLLEPNKTGEPQKVESAPSAASDQTTKTVEPKKVDRQVRVFFSVPESVAAKIELPDSFYNLSAEEIKREAEMRKKKIAESQLLIPKSYKEKQAKNARRKYKKAVIRVQFPDGVVLQGIFNPWEPASNLYEFVSSALKEPCLEFELLHPVVIKRRVIPSFPAAGERAVTLEEEDLVPAALIKFRPIETDSIVFTGLNNELLEIIEPLVTGSAVSPV